MPTKTSKTSKTKVANLSQSKKTLSRGAMKKVKGGLTKQGQGTLILGGSVSQKGREG